MLTDIQAGGLSCVDRYPSWRVVLCGQISELEGCLVLTDIRAGGLSCVDRYPSWRVVLC